MEEIERYLLDQDIARMEAESQELTPYHIAVQTVRRTGMWTGCPMVVASAMMDYVNSLDVDDAKSFGLYQV